MAQKSLVALDFTRPSFLEALGGAFVCFELWHDVFSLAFGPNGGLLCLGLDYLSTAILIGQGQQRFPFLCA